MKSFGIKFIFSAGFVVISIVLLALKFYLFAALGCLIAFALNIREIKFYSTIYQFINFRIQTLLIGFCIDHIVGAGYWFTILGLVLPFAGIFRLELFKIFCDSKYIALDVTATLIMYGIYFYANLQHPLTWEAWALPLFPMFYATFLSLATAFTKGKYNGKNKEDAALGNKVPAFSLPDTNGNIVSLSDFSGKNHVLLIFVRGDWCPTCHIMIRAYEMNRDKFLQKGIIPIGVSPDSNEINKAMMERLGGKNMLLTDEKQEVATKYGLLFKGNNSATEYEQGIILPASFLIDKNGILRYMSSPDNAGEFLSPTLIFPVIETLS
jgi:peroxiredoxin Q/BCP